MKTFNLIRSLLIGIISFGLFHTSNGYLNGRPEEVSVSVLREGCNPFVHSQCPTKMSCWVDFYYPKFGSCVCNTEWSLRMKPPTPLEPGSELAKAPHRSDCVIIGPLNVGIALVYAVLAIVSGFQFYNSGYIVKCVIKNGGFKMNSSVVALVAVCICAFSTTVRYAAFAIVKMNWDRDGDVNYLTDTWAGFSFNLFANLAALESCVTWFDLWQKSVTMSKRSMKVIWVLKVLLRIYSVMIAVGFSLSFAGLSPVGLSSAAFLQMVNNGSQWAIIILCSTFAPLLGRILCKDRKDVTNPNWKAAQAIQVTGIYAAVTALSFNFFIRGIIKIGIFIQKAQHVNEAFTVGLFVACLIYIQAWYQYLQFAHRRYMGDMPTSRISQYFGFTTIGWNGSTRESTIASQNSSVASVSTSSSAEGGPTETDAKGTMA